MNIFMPNNSGIVPKQIYLDIYAILFLLMNIFGHSFEMLDSNQNIQIKPLNKVIVVIQTNLDNLTLQRLMLKYTCPNPLFLLHHLFIFFLSKYLVNILYMNIFLHSFVNILHRQIYSNIHSWKCKQLNIFGHSFASYWQ